MLLTEDEVLIG